MINTMRLCPFCGGKPELIIIEKDMDTPDTSSVRCKVCGARGGTPTHYPFRCSQAGFVISASGKTDSTLSWEEAVRLHDEEAISLWNKRKLKLKE